GHASPTARDRPAPRRARPGSGPRGRAPPRRARPSSPRTRGRYGGSALARRWARNSAEHPAELGDEPDPVAGAAGHTQVVAAGALEERGAGHVDVGPRSVTRELVQELGGERGGGLAQRRAVLHVGERRVDVAAVPRVQRERPDE